MRTARFFYSWWKPRSASQAAAAAVRAGDVDPIVGPNQVRNAVQGIYADVAGTGPRLPALGGRVGMRVEFAHYNRSRDLRRPTQIE
jgi:hypothetical protein